MGAWRNARRIVLGRPRLVSGGVVGLLMLLAMVHAAVVAPHYHVGSFDDDASYLLVARALAHGAGLTTRLPTGLPLASTYPPGYAALLTPLVFAAGRGVLAYRALSGALFAATIPLTWYYLRRQGVGFGARSAVLLLLALSPVAATFATMVMAEMPFLVVLLLALFAVGRWDRTARAWTPAGIAAVTAAAALIWLKEAGVGVSAGLVCWLLVRKEWRKAGLTVAGLAVLLSPVIVARVIAGTPLLGARYSSEIGGYYSGGLAGRVLHVAPHALTTYVSQALPRSIVPVFFPDQPVGGPVPTLLNLITWTAAPLVVLGFVRWVRYHRDSACLLVPVYIAETLAFPYINERRVILVLPVILAWYVLGGQWAYRLSAHWLTLAAGWRAARSERVARRGAGRVPRPERPAAVMAGRLALPTLAVALVLTGLSEQFSRDYLYALGAGSSTPRGSTYMQLLSQLGRPGAVVETDYLWTTALDSGHRTANDAFNAGCDPIALQTALRADQAAYVLTASLNSTGPGNPCLTQLLSQSPSAVPLYQGPPDAAEVFELVGPGTAHPGVEQLADVPAPALGPIAAGTAGDAVPAAEGVASNPVAATASWPALRMVTQVSVGAVVSAGGQVSSVRIQLRTAGGPWVTVAAERVRGASAAPLVADPAVPVAASGVRVVVAGAGAVQVQQLHVLAERG